MPTFDQRIEQLSPAKRALLEKWRNAAAQSATAGDLVPPRPRGVAPPLSFAQQRLWIIDQVESGTAHYNVATAIRLEGSLDPDVLESALQQVIARHESLRTTFQAADGRPVQVIAERLDWRLRRVSLSERSTSAREAAWRQLAEAESLEPFDLAHGPLIRGTLIELAPQEHVLLLTLHHIVCDGWSMAVLRQEVAQLYAAVAGQEHPLPALPLQYADYAAWQRQQLDTAALDRLGDYWTTQLASLPAPLELPLDHPRPQTQTYRGDVCRLRIDSGLASSLRQVAKSENATLFMVLEAALQVLLTRFTGQRDFCIGTPVANRNNVQWERLIGFFVNTVVLRADLSANPTLRQLLAEVRQTTLAAFAHQEMPFEQLVERLQVERDLSRSPLFQVLFVLQNIPLAVHDVAGLSVTEVSFDHAPVASFDLTLNVDEQRDHLDLSLIYNVDLFERSTIERMLASYEIVLRGFAGALDCPALELPLISASDRERALAVACGRAPHAAAEHCVHELITAQAQRTPDALALVHDERELTYRELDERSNQLAHFLAERGVRPDTVVGLCFDRSIDLIVSMLGILKAGGAYLPLDPAYPQARLDYMVRDSGITLLLTTAELAAKFDGLNLQLVCVDHEAAGIAAASSLPLQCGATPHHLANVIYTSGSTGNPKGVEIEHRGLSNHAAELAARLGLGPGDRMLLYLSVSFDAAGEEIFPTLVSGATISLHSAPGELFGSDLLDWSRRNKVNCLHVTPTIWLTLIDALESQGLHAGAHLKCAIAGGDSVGRTDIARWRKVTNDSIPYFIAYGVTEATITTTLLDSRHDYPPSSAVQAPIGLPIAGSQIYVLDQQRRLVPFGVPGELYLGGVGVARGYRNRPELTAERFIANPFGASGDRLYKTGDRGRCLADGTIEFQGRFDQQLKIRGYRIEPGEIETALRQLPGVIDAVVVAVDGGAGHKQLVGYVAAHGAARPVPVELRAALMQILPAHLIPAYLVVLDELPRLPNGKINRRALPTEFRQQGTPGDALPRNEVERLLASIWSSVLNLATVGIHDNFFEIGGDSIRSIQVVARARDAGLRFTPKQLFLHQTIAELAPHVATAAAISAAQGEVVGQAPLSPIQRQFFALEVAEPQHFNQAVLLEVRTPVSAEMIARAIAVLVGHHDALRSRFVRDSAGNWTQTGLPMKPSLAHVEAVDLAEIADEELHAAIERVAGRAQARLNLESAQLVRAVYFDLGSHRGARVLIAIHHLVVDAVSWRILIEDLSLLCEQLARGMAPQLPPKTTSFAEWSRRLVAHADDPAVLAELPQWMPRTAIVPVPRDDAQATNLVAAEAVAEVSLTVEETSRWLQESHGAYRTRPQELLLAALVETLCDHLHSTQVCVALEGHGREDLFDDVDLSRTVGWFTSLYPRTLRSPAGGEAGALIRSVKEQLRGIPQGGLGYGLLRWLSSDSQIRDRLAAASRPEICFNYLGQFDGLLPAEAPFCLATEAIGPTSSPVGERPHVWEILAYVRDRRLTLEWRFGSGLHRRTTIESLANQLIARLRELIAHCCTPGVGSATPTDFPLAGLDQADLDQLSLLLADEQAAESGSELP